MWRNLAKRLPRFSVGSLFVVMTCSAIGMAVGTSPPKEGDDLSQLFSFYVPQLNWAHAFLAMASCFVIVELWRQQKRLSEQCTNYKDRAEILGCRWEVAARRLVALLLAALLVFVVLIQYDIVKLSDRDENLFSLSGVIFPQATWYAAFFLGLTLASARPARTTKRKSSKALDELVAWVGGTILLFYLVSQFYLVVYLVHIATEGIEKSRTLRSQMPNAFPSHRQEGWFTFIVAFASFAAILLAAKCFVELARKHYLNGMRLIVIAAFVSLLAYCTLFCGWFYFREFHRVSPYLAETVGESALLRDWLSLGLIGLLFTAAWARNWSVGLTHTATKLDEPELETVKASGMLLLSTAPTMVSAGLLTSEVVRTAVSVSFSFLGAKSIIEVFQYLFADPILLLQIASGLLALQIAWRWLRRGAPEIVVHPIEPRRVFWTWLGLVALVIVGVPVIAAFGFCWWLGPWYLW